MPQHPPPDRPDRTFASEIRLRDRWIGDGHPALIVAELSGNHNGDLGRALEIVDAAADAGVDAVKLQTYTADSLTIDASTSWFQVGGGTLWDGRTLYELYGEARTPWEWTAPLFERAAQHGLLSFSTPFDATAVEFLEQFDPPAHKVASFELIDPDLLRVVASTGRPILLSTGMAEAREIDEAIETLADAGATEVVTLWCNSSYPARPEELNLRTIEDLAQRTGTLVGFSDHSPSSDAATIAVALGASVIEKHVTLRRSDGGPDSEFSLEPAELAELVRRIRATEASLGAVTYGASPSEQRSLVFRRSLFFVEDIAAGEVVTDSHVRSIRPGTASRRSIAGRSSVGWRPARSIGAARHVGRPASRPAVSLFLFANGRLGAPVASWLPERGELAASCSTRLKAARRRRVAGRSDRARLHVADRAPDIVEEVRPTRIVSVLFVAPPRRGVARPGATAAGEPPPRLPPVEPGSGSSGVADRRREPAGTTLHIMSPAIDGGDILVQSKSMSTWSTLPSHCTPGSSKRPCHVHLYWPQAGRAATGPAARCGVAPSSSRARDARPDAGRVAADRQAASADLSALRSGGLERDGRRYRITIEIAEARRTSSSRGRQPGPAPTRRGSGPLTVDQVPTAACQITPEVGVREEAADRGCSTSPSSGEPVVPQSSDASGAEGTSHRSLVVGERNDSTGTPKARSSQIVEPER